MFSRSTSFWLLLVHPYIYIIGYAYIIIYELAIITTETVPTTHPTSLWNIFISGSNTCFFQVANLEWTVFTFTHASGVIPPASNSSIQFYPAVLISTNRNLSTVCWTIIAIGYIPLLGSDIYTYIIPISFFLRVNSNFCPTIKKLWVGSPKPWYPQRPCCQVAMFPPIGVKGRLRQLAMGSNAWERRRSSRLRCFFQWLCGDFPFNIGSDQGLQMAVWSCLLRSNFRHPQVQRILFLVFFSPGFPPLWWL